MLTKRARDMGILGNKISSKDSFRGKGKFPMPKIICKPAFALWNNAIFEGKALMKKVGSLVSSITNRPVLVFCETRRLARTVFEGTE